jgi:hypothetical protein
MNLSVCIRIVLFVLCWGLKIHIISGIPIFGKGFVQNIHWEDRRLGHKRILTEIQLK